MRWLEDMELNVMLITKVTVQKLLCLLLFYCVCTWQPNVFFNTKGQLINQSGLQQNRTNLWFEITHTKSSCHLLSSRFFLLRPGAKAISSRLLRQFPVTGVILSLKKDGCSHNNLHGSYQTHTTTATGKKGNYSNHLIFSPAPPAEWGYLKFQQIRAKSDMNEMFQKIWPKQFQVVRLYNERKRSEKSYLKKIGCPVTAWAFWL